MEDTCSRREALRYLGVLGAATTAGLWNADARAAETAQHVPNILFIMSDDHAAHAMSCYGSRINKTPHLDRIAQEGVRFEHCYCTNALCAPSRAAILTGKYSHLNGVKDNTDVFDGGQQTFPKLLQKAGYRTAIIGKWHLKSDPTGFDYWNILPGQGDYVDPEMIEMGEKKKRSGYVTDLITNSTIDFIKNRKPDAPFCVLCQHKAPHRNWIPDASHAKLYEDADIPLPETFNDDYKDRAAAASKAEMRVDRDLTESDVKGPPPEGLAGDALKKWKYQRYIKDYLRVIASIDDNVGRLLDFLDEQHLAENTLVVYTSDQGFFLGDHGWFDKRFMYEESLRMPLLMRFPGVVPPGRINRDMVLNVDFGPTFLDIAGVLVPKDMQGHSVLPLLRGHTPGNWRRSMYYQYFEYPAMHSVLPHYGIRTPRYKLIHYAYKSEIDEWELFDLEKDPQELHSVYADPQYADTVKQLKQELQRLRKELKIPEGA